MTKVTRNCEQCKLEFEADTREIKRNRAKFCSLKCSRKAQTYVFDKNSICKQCGIEFKSAVKHSKYCSNVCKMKNYRERSKSDTCIRQYYSYFKDIPCENCNWNLSKRDLHHITPVSEGGKNTMDNLISLCPNCHRLVHNNLISKDKLNELVASRTISSSSSEELGAVGSP